MNTSQDKTDIWIPAENDLTTGDVIRWVDIIWSDKKCGKGKAKKHIIRGKQEITGQIEDIKDDLMSIKIITAEIIEDNSGRKLDTYSPDDIIKKKVQTLVKREAKRLKWTDESARNAVTKNFKKMR